MSDKEKEDAKKQVDSIIDSFSKNFHRLKKKIDNSMNGKILKEARAEKIKNFKENYV